MLGGLGDVLAFLGGGLLYNIYRPLPFWFGAGITLIAVGILCWRVKEPKQSTIAAESEAGLAFLGIRDPTLVRWGMMMRDALSFSYLNVWQWWLVPTGVALSLTIIGLTFIGHAAEPVIEPRLRGAEVA